MASRTTRRAILTLALIIAALGLGYLLLPLLASTDAIRGRMAREMGAWTGYRVILASPPEIKLFPEMSVTLRNVRFENWGQDPGTPPIEVERVEAALSPVAALTGNVELSNIVLVRPTFSLVRQGNGNPLFRLPTGGRVANALARARAVVASGEDEQDQNAIPSGALGAITVTEGRIVIAGPEGSEDESVITDLEGTVRWPNFRAPAELSMVGIWNGESTRIDAEARSILMLMAGGRSAISLLIESAPLSFSYNGEAGNGEIPDIKGEVKLTTPSFRRLAEWTRSGFRRGGAIGQFELATNITGDGTRLKMDNTQLVLNENSGAGVLDLALGNGVPSLAGTLDFDTLDLRAFLSSFSNPPENRADVLSIIDMDFAKEFGLDLRLSAERADLGHIELNDVAATAQIKDGLAVFDISTASAFGGTVQAGVRLDSREVENTGELRVLATEVDGAQIGNLLDMELAIPAGTGNVSLILKGPARTWQSLLDQSRGSFSAKFRDGSFSRLDLEGFLSRIAKPGFFSLSEIGNEPLVFKSAELETQIDNGSAVVQRAEIQTPQHVIQVDGIIPYRDRSLALSGVVTDKPKEGEAATLARFFIGGSWNAPFVTPNFGGGLNR